MMTYRIDKLDPARKFGIAISGLTEGDLASDAVRTDLHRLWIEHGLIVFRGEASSSFHIALSKVFGPCELHPVKETRIEEFPELIEVQYSPTHKAYDTGVYEVGGKELGGWLPWHKDNIYVSRINHGGILRALTVPPEGGNTGFIDQIEAYEALPNDLKARIEDLLVVYKMRMHFADQRYASPVPIKLLRTCDFVEKVVAREETDFPLVVHPAVYRQKETGRPVLNISPMFAEYIYGMDNAEGHKLLRRLVDHVSSSKFAFYHKWVVGEMVLWDNWRTLHSAEGVDPQATRWMRRTTIGGDYSLGRKLADLELQSA
jgi:taurine dioxygenase